MRKWIIAGSLAVLAIAGCKSSDFAQIGSLGHEAHVKCYSGNLLIYEGDSTGNVSNEGSSDGWYWKDAKTGRLVEVSGSCVFLY